MTLKQRKTYLQSLPVGAIVIYQYNGPDMFCGAVCMKLKDTSRYMIVQHHLGAEYHIRYHNLWCDNLTKIELVTHALKNVYDPDALPF